MDNHLFASALYPLSLRVLGMCIAVFLAVSAFNVPIVAQEATPSPDAGGEILFVRHAIGEPGGEGLYVINADGTGERLLFLFSDVGLPYDVFEEGLRCPVWSPDGTQIAFNGVDLANNSAYLAVVNADGSGLRRVLDLQHDEQTHYTISFPEWTPDGERLSFGFTESEPASGRIFANGIRTVNLDGTDLTTLRDDLTLTYSEGSPTSRFELYGQALFHSWSPDGTQLAVASYGTYVYVMDADGSNLRQMTASENANYSVAWSPDGNTIASGRLLLRAFSPDDTDGRDLLDIPMSSTSYDSLAWSPDSRELAYLTYEADIQGEYVYWHTLGIVDVETGETREVLRTPNTSQYDYPNNMACVDWRPTASAD